MLYPLALLTFEKLVKLKDIKNGSHCFYQLIEFFEDSGMDITY